MEHIRQHEQLSQKTVPSGQWMSHLNVAAPVSCREMERTATTRRVAKDRILAEQIVLEAQFSFCSCFIALRRTNKGMRLGTYVIPAILFTVPQGPNMLRTLAQE